MRDAHEAGKGSGCYAAALIKHLAGHTKALALRDTATLADSYACSILATLKM